uniref:protein FAM110C n=1 Tax=Jaculus jaculus TaxID=51337 RepID=UPI001E1AFC35|nr:protein FAM110C [Jaculus jaculus]
MRALPALDAPASSRAPGPQAEAAARSPRPGRRSAAERLAADRARYVRGPAPEGGGSGAPAGQPRAPAPPARAPAPVARRAIARKPLRPDSLVIYRQKCEFVRGPGAEGSRGGLVKKLFQGPGKDKVPEVTGEDKAGEAEAARTKPDPVAATPPARKEPRVPAAVAPAPQAPLSAAAAPEVPAAGGQLQVVRRRGLQRSQSDLSSRYSVAKADLDTFFRYCGLDPEVVEALGRENFSAGSDRVALKVRSVSVATSDSGFSRHSEDGLQEEELLEQVPSTTSVVERNARIIKWLYTCKKAKETPSQGLQGPA